MSGILQEMRASARRRLAELPVGEPAAGDPDAFPGALRGRTSLSVIAEVKRASPSRGPLALDADAVAQARRYVDAGAAAVSFQQMGPLRVGVPSRSGFDPSGIDGVDVP